jgi:hypothetical protein
MVIDMSFVRMMATMTPLAAPPACRRTSTRYMSGVPTNGESQAMTGVSETPGCGTESGRPSILTFRGGEMTGAGSVTVLPGPPCAPWIE